jgi:flagellar protein FlaG
MTEAAMFNEISKSMLAVVQPVSQGSAPAPVSSMDGAARLRVAEMAAGRTAPASNAGISGALRPESNSPVDAKRAEELARDLQNLVQASQRRIQFNVDNDSGSVVIQVVDAETDEVIRQIPPEVIQQLRARFAEMATGLESKEPVPGMLFDTRA